MAVWRGRPPRSSTAAEEEYEQRLEQAEDKADQPVPEIVAYVEDLLERLPGEPDDRSPWAGVPLLSDAAGDFLLLTLRREALADSARDICAQLAAQRGLVCFDPQTGRLLSRPS